MNAIRTSRWSRVFVPILAVVAGVGLALTISAWVFGPPETGDGAQAEPADQGEAHTKYPVNAAGQTYGSLADATSEIDAPDLILVEMDDGNEGYVLAAELFAAEGGDISNPKEAAEWTFEPVPLEVYESNGRTVIGVWHGLDRGEEQG